MKIGIIRSTLLSFSCNPEFKVFEIVILHVCELHPDSFQFFHKLVILFFIFLNNMIIGAWKPETSTRRVPSIQVYKKGALSENTRSNMGPHEFEFQEISKIIFQSYFF